MSQQSENLNNIICNLMNFLHEDILLNKLDNTELENKVCFDCQLWNKGLNYPDNSMDPQIRILPIKKHFLRLLTSIEQFIKCELSNTCNKNYDYKSQLDRFLCILLDMKNKIASIICSNSCNDINIISVLLTTIIQTILNLINILENLNTLLSTYSEDCNCACINLNTFNISMGLFINSVTQFQCLLQDWYIIAVTFFNLNSCTVKPYVASYVPKTYITPPKPFKPISHSCPPCVPNNTPNTNDCFNNRNNLNCT